MKKTALIFTLCLSLLLCACTGGVSDDVQSVEPNLDEMPTATTSEEQQDEPEISLPAFELTEEETDLQRNIDKICEIMENGEEAEVRIAYSDEIYSFSKLYVPVSHATVQVNDESVNINEFATAEEAEKYLAGFSSYGNQYTETDENGNVLTAMMIDYVAPIHYWISGNCVISYASFTSDFLSELNSLYGNEAVGVGAEYYYPIFAQELLHELSNVEATGIGVFWNKVEPTANQLYYNVPKRICQVRFGGEEISVMQFGTESEALDHASRFSPDGLTYTGVGGNSNATIQLQRAKPTFMFRKGDIVVEYATETGMFVEILCNIYGNPFADPNKYGLDSGTLNFTAQAVRTDQAEDCDCIFPQYAIIKSVEELQRYYQENKDQFDLERRGMENATIGGNSNIAVGWLNVAEKYDTAWFETHDLVLIVLREGSGSISHKVSGVLQTENGGLKVDITRVIPEVCTDDMAWWHLFVGVEAGILSPIDEIDIDIVNKYQSEMPITDPEPSNDPDLGVTMQVSDVTPEGLTLKISQNGGKATSSIWYGVPYTLQVLEGKWVEVPYATSVENVTWIEIAVELSLGGSTTESIKWQHIYGSLPAGKYRICKSFSASTGEDKYESQNVFAEFEIK